MDLSASRVSPENMPFVEKTAQMLGVTEKPGNEKFNQAVRKALENTRAKKEVLNGIAKKEFNGDVSALQERLDIVEKNLNYSQNFNANIEKTHNKGVLSKVKDALLYVPKKVGGFLWQHKGKILLGLATAAAIYLGIKYMPSWDQIMAWVQRLRGAGAAVAANTGVGAPAYAAPGVADNLVNGGITSVTPTQVPNDIEDIMNLMRTSPGVPPTPPIR